MNWLRKLWARLVWREPPEPTLDQQYQTLQDSEGMAYDDAIAGRGSWADVEYWQSQIRDFEQEHGL